MNIHGINFDIGLPLKTEHEFKNLFVDYNDELSTRFKVWLQNKNADAIVIGGQIGTGKSTFINKIITETKIIPQIKLELDKFSHRTTGSFFGYFLGKLIKYAINIDIDINKYGFSVAFQNQFTTIDNFIDLLVSKSVNIKHLKEQKELFYWFSENQDIIENVILDICKQIEKKENRKLFIFAEGVDKYNPLSADFKLLNVFLNFISKYKTIFEVNIVHTLQNYTWNNRISKIILTNTEHENIYKILEKRIGEYKDIIPKIIDFSGGNPRQAIRLFVEYEFAKFDLEKSDKKALEFAVNQTRKSMFIFENIHWQLLKTVNKENSINEGTLINEEKNGNSVYRNIILLQRESETGKIPAIINPLFIEEFRKYDNYYDIEQKDEFSIEKADFQFKLTEALQYLAILFFNKTAKEIVIISYDDIKIAKITNDYLIGRAGSYREIDFKETNLIKNNFSELFIDADLTKDEINSVFFNFELDNEEITLLDKTRDKLIEKDMLWWIRKEKLINYLNKWTQLRQFVKILDLKDNILRYIKRKDIEQDLDNLDFLDYTEEQKNKIKQKLETIINYLDENE